MFSIYRYIRSQRLGGNYYDMVFAAARDGNITGLFEKVVTVKGIEVTVRGNVIDGVVRISTAFIASK